MLSVTPDLWHDLFVPAVPVIRVVLRGTVMYLALFFALRLLRRQAGAVGISDLLVVVLLADAAQNGMAGPYTSITEGLALVGTILLWDYVIDWLGYRSAWWRKVLRPEPLVLVLNGAVRKAPLRRQMLTEEDLMVQLRQHGVTEVSKVRECRLEPDGHISVVTTE